MAKIEAGISRPIEPPKVEGRAQSKLQTVKTVAISESLIAGKDSKIGERINLGLQLKGKILGETAKSTLPPDIKTQATVNTDPVNNRIIIDAGAGDDTIRVTQDATSGDVTVNVNGAERTFTGADRNNLYIKAGNGNDTIYVSPNVTVNLMLDGNAGDDTIYGGGGRDYINGSTGNDRIYGRGGDDVIYGGDGDDFISGGSGDDYADGGNGNDRIYGFSGSDTLSGGIGDDTVNGGSGDDVLYAGEGKDNLIGSNGNNSIYAQTADDTIQGSDSKNSINNTVINVLLEGNPGGTAVKIEGSPEFIERVEADLETLRSSPAGRAMLESFDQSYADTRSRFAGSPVIGGMFNDGTTVTIKETSGGNSAQKLESGRSDAQINYNLQRVSLGGGGWRDRPPIIGLHHEMAHAYDFNHDTLAPGKYTGTDNPGVNNLERVAVGLPIDHDFDPSTPNQQATNHPTNLTENTFRDEMGLSLRPRY